MSKLAGKTIFITGGSQGIGLAIVLKCLSAGANVVCAAKEQITLDQNLNTKNILSLLIDISNEDQIRLAVDKAISQFGSIDVLVNNASAFCFTNTVNTTSDTFDLLYSVNVRGTFLTSQICLPHLIKAANPHIINISPPLDLNSRWFTNHLAFTISKYGMSMCTLGMATEFQANGVAVNSLWPQTTIATQTIKDHFVSNVYAGSRLPTIMADAAYELMQKNALTCTGQFFIDEEVLREVGVNDFSQYAVNPNFPVMQDLFIPEKNLDKNGINTVLTKDFFINH